MAGTDAHYEPPAIFGQSFPSFTDVSATASGTWVDAPGSDLVLPEAGTYLVQADVIGSLNSTVPTNVSVSARLFNVTTGGAVPNTTRPVVQVASGDTGGYTLADNDVVPITRYITVTGPTTIRLQASRSNTAGSTWGIARLSAPMTMVFQKVAD